MAAALTIITLLMERTRKTGVSIGDDGEMTLVLWSIGIIYILSVGLSKFWLNANYLD